MNKPKIINDLEENRYFEVPCPNCGNKNGCSLSFGIMKKVLFCSDCKADNMWINPDDYEIVNRGKVKEYPPCEKCGRRYE